MYTINFRNQISPRFHTVCLDKIHKRKSQCELSPASYDPVQKQRGKYFNSLYINVATRTFSKSKRPSLADRSKLSTPGFNYKRFSEFGCFI